MSDPSRRPRPDYDRVARWFRPLELGLFGRSLARTRSAFLDRIEAPRRALLLGEGDGRFVVELLERFESMRVDVIEGSSKMIELARRRVEHARVERDSDAVRWLHDDIRTAEMPGGPYDLIVSNFVLDCLDEREIETLVERVTANAGPRATWLIADFREPSSGVLAILRARVWLAFLYAFFGLVARQSVRRLVDPAPVLRTCGWRLEANKRYRLGLLEASCWSAPEVGSTD